MCAACATEGCEPLCLVDGQRLEVDPYSLFFSLSLSRFELSCVEGCSSCGKQVNIQRRRESPELDDEGESILFLILGSSSK